MAKSFPIGSLDKTKRFVKTESGWVSVKKLEKGNIVNLPSYPGLSIATVYPKEVAPRPARYATIYEAQVAFALKKITHQEFLEEQAALYAAGILSKKHSHIKLK
jgi:hypothetical protein